MSYADLRLFASEAHPLRPSKLGDWARCPWKAAMEFMQAEERESGKAADTGSAIHAATAAWHNDPAKRVNVALGVMWTKAAAEYPQADLKAAEKFFRLYIADPRNQTAEVLETEYPVRLSLPAAETDQTQTPIVIEGTLDQLRRDASGALRVIDLKTGARLKGWEMIKEHAVQMACYQVAATETFGEPVHAADILRTMDYLPDPKTGKTGPVFWTMPFGLREARLLLDSLREFVAAVRSGRVYPVPGNQCDWCSLGGLGACVPMLQEYRTNEKAN